MISISCTQYNTIYYNAGIRFSFAFFSLLFSDHPCPYIILGPFITRTTRRPRRPRPPGALGGFFNFVFIECDLRIAGSRNVCVLDNSESIQNSTTVCPVRYAQEQWRDLIEDPRSSTIYHNVAIYHIGRVNIFTVNTIYMSNRPNKSILKNGYS